MFFPAKEMHKYSPINFFFVWPYMCAIEFVSALMKFRYTFSIDPLSDVLIHFP